MTCLKNAYPHTPPPNTRNQTYQNLQIAGPAGGGSVINGATLSSFRYMSILTDVLAWIFLRMAKWTDTLVEIL